MASFAGFRLLQNRWDDGTLRDCPPWRICHTARLNSDKEPP